MFEPQSQPRFFTLPIGVDFLSCFVDGLLDRMMAEPPERLASIEIYVNTQRTSRRLRDLFVAKGPSFLPKIRLITEIAQNPIGPLELPKPISKLERRLKLAQLVSALIQQQPDLGPKSSAIDLADALADLLDEMQGEAVSFDALTKIVDDELSGHWQRSLQFLRIVADHWDENSLTDTRDRQRQVATAFDKLWRDTPPENPVLIVGSTGSRGETAAFMKAVSKLPQGAVILPGVDQNMPEHVWQAMADDSVTLDHPQAIMERLVRDVGLNLWQLPHWKEVTSKAVERSRLVSLAMRPAPITDQWLTDGPKIAPIVPTALETVDVIQAASPKDEANAIALRLRRAVEDGIQSVLITPDRVLARRVTSALGQWGIVPDDSGGEPLHLTPPGILLRLTAGVLGEPLSPAKLIAILKHPLTHSGPETDGNSRRFSREMEVSCLRGSGPVVDFANISTWVEKVKDPHLTHWFKWLKNCFDRPNSKGDMPLTDWVAQHLAFAESIAAGLSDQPSELWAKKAGEVARQAMANLSDHAQHGGVISASEYRALLNHILSSEEVREPTEAHPLIAIWGTLEARVQGAELVILGGLNEGIWPKPANPDPWLNRTMRKELGLLLPERQTGLSAHDFQQAISAPQVVLSRAERDGDSPTIPSRWIIRLFNLIKGLEGDPKLALDAAIQRGDQWLRLASTLGRPTQSVNRETRPSPIPPVTARPKKLSVTKIETLIRDPYEIYAKYILRLNKLEPLGRDADALARGIAIHAILEKFVKDARDHWPEHPVAKLLQDAEAVLEKDAPWPAARKLWLARIELVAEWLVANELTRRTQGKNIALEREGQLILDQIDFTLTVKADRLDLLNDGRLAIYDYKAGSPPTLSQIKQFNKQLPLEGLIAANGGFDKIDAMDVGHLEFIGLAVARETRPVDVSPESLAEIKAELIALLSTYLDESKGYTARDRVVADRFEKDYDHLSRRGEWQDSDPPDPKAVT